MELDQTQIKRKTTSFEPLILRHTQTFRPCFLPPFVKKKKGFFIRQGCYSLGNDRSFRSRPWLDPCAAQACLASGFVLRSLLHNHNSIQPIRNWRPLKLLLTTHVRPSYETGDPKLNTPALYAHNRYPGSSRLLRASRCHGSGSSQGFLATPLRASPQPVGSFKGVPGFVPAPLDSMTRKQYVQVPLRRLHLSISVLPTERIN